METKHTPGPWNAHHHFCCDKWHIVTAKGEDVIGTHYIGDSYDGDTYGACDNEADAKLIAAAPDLLEALQDMGVRYGLTEQARAAIKKATE